MSSTVRSDDLQIPIEVNFVSQGKGNPVVLIHGLAASLHDWDVLIPRLVESGYSTYALDLLGHGDSPKINSRAYQMEWLYEHFSNWMRSLHLTEPAILVGHSLGGYLALEYARRVPAWTRGLVLVNPLYSLSQLPPLLAVVREGPAGEDERHRCLVAQDAGEADPRIRHRADAAARGRRRVGRAR